MIVLIGLIVIVIVLIIIIIVLIIIVSIIITIIVLTIVIIILIIVIVLIVIILYHNQFHAHTRPPILVYFGRSDPTRAAVSSRGGSHSFAHLVGGRTPRWPWDRTQA